MFDRVICLQHDNGYYSLTFLLRNMEPLSYNLQMAMYIFTVNIQTSMPEQIVCYILQHQTRPQGYKIFFMLCSAQLSLKLVLLISLKLFTTANSFLLNISERENFSANKHENVNYCWHFHIY